jgi:hypothetical protein
MGAQCGPSFFSARKHLLLRDTAAILLRGKWRRPVHRTRVADGASKKKSSGRRLGVLRRPSPMRRPGGGVQAYEESASSGRGRAVAVPPRGSTRQRSAGALRRRPVTLRR